MFQFVNVDPKLADGVEKELFSIKASWQYSPRTTLFYELNANEDEKKIIDEIRQKYPMIDTQKFSDTFFYQNENVHPDKKPKFIETRLNKKSRYNVDFPNLAKLLDHLQSNYIPKEYCVKRFFANMQTIRPTWTLNQVHPDFRHSSFITILYYVNDSDGDTLFFEGSECINRTTPVKGTAVVYPSKTLHAGSTPTKHDTRVVINMVFGPKP